ncbi:hypothetical protein D3C84_954910 [compost metagenome]
MFAVFVLEYPLIAIQGIKQAQALMLVQRQRLLWNALAAQVVRGGARYAVDLSEGLGDQLRIGQFGGDRNHHVVPLLQWIGIALGQGQFEHHVGI